MQSSLTIVVKSARVKLLFTSVAHDGVVGILVYRAAHRVCPDRNNMQSRLEITSKFARVKLLFSSDAHDGVTRILVYRAAHRVCPARNNRHSRLYLTSTHLCDHVGVRKMLI